MVRCLVVWGFFIEIGIGDVWFYGILDLFFEMVGLKCFWFFDIGWGWKWDGVWCLFIEIGRGDVVLNIILVGLWYKLWFVLVLDNEIDLKGFVLGYGCMRVGRFRFEFNCWISRVIIFVVFVVF